jgi:hypothetical protein
MLSDILNFGAFLKGGCSFKSPLCYSQSNNIPFSITPKKVPFLDVFYCIKIFLIIVYNKKMLYKILNKKVPKRRSSTHP